MKYDVIRTKKFRKELKKMLKRGADVSKLETVVGILASGRPCRRSIMTMHSLGT